LSSDVAFRLAIYGEQFNPQITLKALSYFDDGNLSRLAEATKHCLAKAAREVDLDRLPAIGRGAQRRDE